MKKEQHRVMLDEAKEHIERERNTSAMTFIVAVLDEDRKNPEAWYLVAVASRKPDERCKALQNALSLRPDYPEARQLYAQLGCSEEELQRVQSKRKPCAAVASLLMVAVVSLSLLILI